MHALKLRAVISISVLISGVTMPAAVRAGSLMGVDITNSDVLYQFPTSGGIATTIGSLGLPNPDYAIDGLGFDPIHSILYGTESLSNTLYIINASTGATTHGAMGGLNHDDVTGLEYHIGKNALYAADASDNKLFTINPATGVGSAGVSLTGFSDVEGLAYRPSTNTMFGISNTLDRVAIINVDTGVCVPLPTTLPAASWQGLAFNPDDGFLYATAYNDGTSLYRINASTGAATLLDGVYLPGQPLNIHGLAYVPAPGAMAMLTIGLPFHGRSRRRRLR